MRKVTGLLVVWVLLNTRLLRESYEKLGGPIQVKVIPSNVREISPDYFECQELVDFILKQMVSSINLR